MLIHQHRKMFAKNSKMANGLIHPIVRAISYAVVLEHSGENKNVKFAILVPISIRMKKLVNGLEWIKLIAKNLSKVMIIPLLV